MTTPTDFNVPSLKFPIEKYVPAEAPRPPISTHKHPYKNKRTEMCHNIMELGRCSYGENCSFAHCVDEMNALSLQHPPEYHTKLCKNFFGEGVCYYGTRCRFSHSLSYAHSLGYVYDPSISAYVKDRQILYGATKSKIDSKIADCWSARKPQAPSSSNSPALEKDVKPVT